MKKKGFKLFNRNIDLKNDLELEFDMEIEKIEVKKNILVLYFIVCTVVLMLFLLIAYLILKM